MRKQLHIAGLQNRNRSVALMGLGTGGGFTDSFNRADGALGNDWLYTGDWNIVSNKLVGNPAVTGSNLITNGDFETGNPPTGWNAAASNSIAQNADARPGSAGTNSALVTVGGSAFAISRLVNTGITAGRFYKTTYWGKRGSNTQYGTSTFDPYYNNNTSWEEKSNGKISNGTAFTAYLLGSTGTFYVDDVEVKQIVTSNVFAIRDFGKSNADTPVKANRTGDHYGGIVLGVDDITTPTDYITVGIDSYDISAVAPVNVVKVTKVVGGVYTVLLNTGITYVADQVLRVVKNGAAIKVFYNGIQIADDLFASDAGIVNNTKHGLFSTGNSNSFDDFQFAPYSSGLDETPVFTRISEATLWSTSGAKDWLAWPQLRKLSSTRWVMTYVASTGHTDNDLTTTIHIRFSDDEGATWTNEDTKLGGGAVSGGFPMLAHNPASRTLGCLLIVCPNGDLLVHQYDNHDGTFQWRSTDGGDTWTDEGLILDSRFISLDDYEIAGSDIYICVNYTDNYTEPWVNSLYKSSDNGATWTLFSTFDSAGDESGLVIAPNGDWVIVERDKVNLVTYQFRSIDGGLTWGAKTVRPDLYVLQRPRMVLDGAGGIILHGREYLGSDKQKNVLYYSNDNGVTWGRKFNPYVTQTGDGNYNGYIIKENGTYYMITYSGSKIAAGIKQLIFSKS